ncbi:MAG: hypothetical protein ACR2LJ_01725 [Acidimicrobiales bacterium]
MDDPAPGPVEDVITTAIALVTGRLAPREAVTILATLAPRAARAAAATATRDVHPDQAAHRVAVLQALTTEIGAGDDDVRQRRQVVADLATVVVALGGSAERQAPPPA